jgi:hypothetical protein
MARRIKGSQMMELLNPRAPSQNICGGHGEKEAGAKDLQRDQPGWEGRVVGNDHPEKHIPEPAEEEGEGNEDRLGDHTDIGHRDLGRGGGRSGMERREGERTESVVSWKCLSLK